MSGFSCKVILKNQLFPISSTFDMKFIDSAEFQVSAGNGGDGYVSFHRARFLPQGGPDGGDGGAGGSIFLVSTFHINSLSSFNRCRVYHAQDGGNGKRAKMRGKSGTSLVLKTALGVTVYNAHTKENIGELERDGQRLLLARGGAGGLGNTRFKSSTNRSPRQFTQGKKGDAFSLFLELKMLADIGLLGKSNTGKSSFLSRISNAPVRIASYPFSTLDPVLGSVELEGFRHLIVADIPGIEKGASQGSGLGLKFLKHLSKTHVLLHFIDISAYNEAENICISVRNTEGEIGQYNRHMLDKTRWLVFSKIDLIDTDKAQKICEETVRRLNWKETWFMISSVTGKGIPRLTRKLMDKVEDARAISRPPIEST